MQRHTLAGNITTNMKVKMDSTLPKFRATKLWRGSFVDDSAKGRFNMILGRYLSTALGLNLKLPKHIIESGDIPLKLPTAPIVDLGAYKFKDLNTDKITPE